MHRLSGLAVAFAECGQQLICAVASSNGLADGQQLNEYGLAELSDLDVSLP